MHVRQYLRPKFFNEKRIKKCSVSLLNGRSELIVPTFFHLLKLKVFSVGDLTRIWCSHSICSQSHKMADIICGLPRCQKVGTKRCSVCKKECYCTEECQRCTRNCAPLYSIVKMVIECFHSVKLQKQYKNLLGFQPKKKKQRMKFDYLFLHFHLQNSNTVIGL
jgi:hypothetical protein